MTREFVILPEFDKCWRKIGLTDDDLKELEEYLCLCTEAGDLVPGAGGLRKLRWGIQARGKRGGARVRYVDFAYYEKLYLIGAYPKSVKSNLTQSEKLHIKTLLKQLDRELKG